MSVYRTKKQQKEYHKYTKNLPPNVCVFCDINKDHEQYVSEGRYFKIITNKFPYSFWDGQNVEDHLMIVPIKHTVSFAEMSNEEKIEYLSFVEDYEKLGYDIYARAPQSIVKSVLHQHTHLIKPSGKGKNIAILIRKPYLLFLR